MHYACQKLAKEKESYIYLHYTVNKLTLFFVTVILYFSKSFCHYSELSLTISNLILIASKQYSFISESRYPKISVGR